MSNDFDLLQEVEQVGRDVRRSAEEVIASAHARLLAATAVEGWQSSQKAVATVEAAKAEIEAALKSVPAGAREDAKGIGMFRARVTVARYLHEAAEKSDAASKRIQLEALFVRVLRDALEAGNFIPLPYVIKRGEKVEEVTVESLKATPVVKEIRGEERKFTRGAEILYVSRRFRERLADLVPQPAEGEALALHAPAFQDSPGVQALVLSLQKGEKKLNELATAAWKARQAKKANAGTWKGAPRPNKMERVMAGELKARGLDKLATEPTDEPAAEPEPLANPVLSEEDMDRIAEAQAAALAAAETGSRRRRR
jgi:hypothetical protein